MIHIGLHIREVAVLHALQLLVQVIEEALVVVVQLHGDLVALYLGYPRQVLLPFINLNQIVLNQLHFVVVYFTFVAFIPKQMVAVLSDDVLNGVLHLDHGFLYDQIHLVEELLVHFIHQVDMGFIKLVIHFGDYFAGHLAHHLAVFEGLGAHQLLI